MMSGHGENSIFFIKKKIKIGRPEHLLTPHLVGTSNNTSFLLLSTPPPPSKLTPDVYQP